MKKISTASFIVGVVLVVASIAAIIMGVTTVNSPSVYSHTINGYTYKAMSYSISITGVINGFMMIIIGGIAFVGGMLSFILAAVTRGPKFPPKPCRKPADGQDYYSPNQQPNFQQSGANNGYANNANCSSNNQQASPNDGNSTCNSSQSNSCEY